jgi:hypothetical protein
MILRLAAWRWSIGPEREPSGPGAICLTTVHFVKGKAGRHETAYGNQSERAPAPAPASPPQRFRLRRHLTRFEAAL